MPRTYLHPAGLAVDAAAAARFSHAVRASGTFVFIAGQVANDAGGNIVGKGDAEAQAAQIYANLQKAVESAGGTMADIISTRTYALDAAYRPVIRQVREQYFPGPDYPNNTFLVVAGLASPDYLIEIEAVAHLES